MAKEFMCGQMAESMKELTKMIKSMALEFIHGLMVENMKVIGLMENSMAVDNLYKEMKEEKAFGKKEKELNGWLIALMKARILKNELSIIFILYYIFFLKK